IVDTAAATVEEAKTQAPVIQKNMVDTAAATVEEAKTQAPVIQKDIVNKAGDVKETVAATVEESKTQAPVIQKDMAQKASDAEKTAAATVEESKTQAPVIQKEMSEQQSVAPITETIKTAVVDTVAMAQEKVEEVKASPVGQKVMGSVEEMQAKLTPAVQKPEAVVPVPVSSSQVNPQVNAAPATTKPASEQKALPAKPEDKGSRCTIM
ncbi:uncharacterized protein EV154DRAFT_518708, partial [Mucor mucedo]|uniref:uncharacterized protein n=1 Tax=Mucor mucedo TaxID=29922 RepID=UPI002220212F